MHTSRAYMLWLQVFTVLNINFTTMSMLILFLLKNQLWRDHEPVGWGQVWSGWKFRMFSHESLKLKKDAQLSQRDRAAGCLIVFAKSRTLELGDNDLRTLYVYLQPLSYNRPENLSNSVKKRKIKAITAFKIIQGHRGRYQSKACMRFPISD